VIERHEAWAQRLVEVFGAPADAALHLAAELDAANFAWRQSRREGDRSGSAGAVAGEDPVLFALGSWQLELRRRMLDEPPGRMGPWARLLELSYDTLGYHEQNVSPRLALECFLLEARRLGARAVGV
jgi:hypothetical protein